MIRSSLANAGGCRAARLPGRSLGLLLVGLALGTPAGAVRAAGPVEYNRDIRPILSEYCFRCHGPDSASRKADLRLDRRDDAVELGAIAPGKVDESELVARVFSADKAEVMPPPSTKKVLSASQKELLRRWIAEGAEYQLHWSFLPPSRPVPPKVRHEGWVRTPIDRFVLAKLEEQKLAPAPEADRRSLARRLSLDLTGLPPEPADVERFVNDPAPDAYERYVDRLMASDRWGEHRGRYWLDAARYADTHGIHFDNYREIWAYREWVIRAFNQNMPFDRFTIEQLAGDLLPGRTLDQQVASGFNRCNITTSEGGAIDEEYLVLYTRDRTETTSAVWLGLTANCAVCHDHKFDPLSQREFYEMAAFFNNTSQGAMDGNRQDTPPVIVVPQPEDRPRWEVLAREVPQARAKVEERRKAARADFDAWLAALAPDALRGSAPSDGLKLHAALDEGKGSSLRVTLDGAPRDLDVSAGLAWTPGHVGTRAFQSKPGVNVELPEAGDFEKDQAFSYGAWVKPPANVTGSAFARMDESSDYRGWDLWLEGGRPGAHIIHKWPDDALKVVANNPLTPGAWSHVLVTYNGSGRAEGVAIYVNGQLQPTGVQANTLRNTIRSKVPFKLAQRNTSGRIDDLGLQDLRIYGRALSAAEADRLGRSARAAYIAAKPGAERTDAEKDELFKWWLSSVDATSKALGERLASLEQEEAALRSRGSIAHVMQEKPDMPSAFVLYRGDYDKRREPVKPDTPDVLPPMKPELPRNRLGFAQWLLSPEHPLTARVTVNRFWQELFGTGIVRTPGDFGVSGELPSHPELLDWLAVEFRESGWDVKRLFRTIVTSAAYRQSALVTPEKAERDPNNRLLSRGPRFRMDAEMVRDYALAASGLLVEKLGGPSVKPYQPEGVWEAVAMIGSNTRDYRADRGGNLYRRSLYTFWKRSAPPASMDIFNAPSRETCTVRRERTNTPLQALVTLNDPQFVEAARVLAQNTVKSAATPEARLDVLARRLLARPLREEEARVALGSLEELSAFYKGHAAEAAALIAVGESKPDPTIEAPTLAAWTMLANEMLNLDEVLNK